MQLDISNHAWSLFVGLFSSNINMEDGYYTIATEVLRLIGLGVDTGYAVFHFVLLVIAALNPKRGCPAFYCIIADCGEGQGDDNIVSHDLLCTTICSVWKEPCT